MALHKGPSTAIPVIPHCTVTLNLPLGNDVIMRNSISFSQHSQPRDEIANPATAIMASLSMSLGARVTHKAGLVEIKIQSGQVDRTPVSQQRGIAFLAPFLSLLKMPYLRSLNFSAIPASLPRTSCVSLGPH